MLITIDPQQLIAMAERNEEDVYYIPTLLLPNARAILNAFGESIERISASGSRSEKDTVEQDDDYGFTIDQDFKGSVSLDYRRERDLHGQVENPLTDSKIQYYNQRIHESLSNVKPTSNRDITHDISVSRVIVEVDNDDLRWKFGGPEEETFFFDFQPMNVGDMGEGFKELLEPLFQDRNLLQQGFNWRVPVLYQIVPKRGFDYDGESHNPVFEWNPENTNTSPMEISVSQKITGMLPNDIAYNKDVSVVEEGRWGI